MEAAGWGSVAPVSSPSGKFIRVNNTADQSAFGKAVHRKQSFGTVK